MTPFARPEVAAVFSHYPDTVRAVMLAVRELIFDVAAGIPAVGLMDETLKWGEPAYLTPASRSGSTVRIDWKPRTPEVCGIYFNCQTDLVERFRTLFGDVLTFEGNRAVLVALGRPLPVPALHLCIAAALTYHSDKALR